ncbi:DEKNAAC101657 [Brettanomyces naardenensis]|uniref:DEKNAAC101657 n=1 Tax=Brettanomyces naardenensis TaxID=13370 RepID=A0A448YIS9_BRENA|nr:DEKNAAC101657 [Brettanomyces naardenensis]
MTAKPVVLFVGPLDTNLPEYHFFEEHFTPVFYRLTTKANLIRDLSIDPKLKETCAIYAGFQGFQPIGGLIGDDVIEALPTTLKIITVCSAGFNGYDLIKLRNRNVDFCNTPNFGAPQVAETALYHIVNGFRHFHTFENALKKAHNTIQARVQLQEYTDFDSGDGQFKSITDEKELARIDPWFAFGERVSRDLYVSSPRGKIITIVGFGNIGQELAQMVHSLGMVIRYVKRQRLSADEESKLGYPVEYYRSLLQAATGTDCVALCVPSTPETVGIFNSKVIERLNDRCCVVNVGRGNLIAEDDLLAGLQSGKIGYAGLDVLAEEPQVNRLLITRDDVTITPHLGSCTKEVFDSTAIFCLKNILSKISGGQVQNIQN